LDTGLQGPLFSSVAVSAFYLSYALDLLANHEHVYSHKMDVPNDSDL
jgi:hypothetical protein